ncbi:NAD-P-binding protein [Trametes sanguinea]|nr:NAD-P-binding protein [Trametes sanguinea]
MSALTHSVAILGGTGGLGQHISLAFLTEFRSSFPTVRVLTRDPSSTAAQEIAGKRATLVKLDESNLPRLLDEAFKDIDVVINALPVHISDETKQAAIDAAARSNAKVYFLDEFGQDHRVEGFPGFDHPELINKQRIAAETRKQLKGKKVIALYCGLFFDYSLTPVLGVDVEKNVYSAYGSPSQRSSTTSKTDVARSVARLASLALDPATAHKVPDEVRIAGATVSYEEIRDIVARVKGVPKGEIHSEDLETHKEALRHNPGQNFIEYLRVIIAEGKGDLSADNGNELVNPGESFWKWTSVEDHVRRL